LNEEEGKQRDEHQNAMTPTTTKKKSRFERVDIDDAAYYYGELDEDGNFHGLGLLRYNKESNNHYYFGDWMHGEAHGKGIEVSEDGCYEEDFRCDRCEGYGTDVSENETYSGEWKDGEKHGKGLLRYNKGGDVYEGEFSEGKITGHGCYTWPNGDSHTGYFKESIVWGRGFLRWADGRTFEGNYDNDNREGEGIIRFPDGRQLTANYVNDERRGPAKMEWASKAGIGGGDVWVGEFIAHDRANGVRTFVETGDTLEGIFTDYELKNGGDEKTGSWMTYTKLTSDGKREATLGIWKDERFIPKDEFLKTMMTNTDILPEASS